MRKSLKRIDKSVAINRKTVNKIVRKIKLPKDYDDYPLVLQKQLEYEIKRDRVLVMTLFVSASRISECTNLKKENFDFSLKTSPLYIINGMKNLKNKNRNTKTIGFPPDDRFSNEIKEYVENLKKGMFLFPQRKVTFGFAENKYINKPMNRKTALNRIQRYDKDRWCHWFRHARLSDLAQQGLNDRQLVSVSGHASTNMLQVYVDMSPALYEDKIQPG